MFEYILRLLILLPLVGGMAWGSLWLWKKVQMGTLQLPGQGAKRTRAIEMIDVLPLGPGTKLTVVEFAGQRILLSVSRGAVTRIADGHLPTELEDEARTTFDAETYAALIYAIVAINTWNRLAIVGHTVPGSLRA